MSSSRLPHQKNQLPNFTPSRPSPGDRHQHQAWLPFFVLAIVLSPETLTSYATGIVVVITRAGGDACDAGSRIDRPARQAGPEESKSTLRSHTRIQFGTSFPGRRDVPLLRSRHSRISLNKTRGRSWRACFSGVAVTVFCELSRKRRRRGRGIATVAGKCLVFGWAVCSSRAMGGLRLAWDRFWWGTAGGRNEIGEFAGVEMFFAYFGDKLYWKWEIFTLFCWR